MHSVVTNAFLNDLIRGITMTDINCYIYVDSNYGFENAFYC